AGSGVSLLQMGNANINPWTQAKVNTKNPERGPLLIIEGGNDHTVPWAIANAAYKRQRRNPNVTEIVKIPNRGHAITIDRGWREAAQPARPFADRSRQGAPPGAARARSIGCPTPPAWGSARGARRAPRRSQPRIAASRSPKPAIASSKR